MKACAFLNVDIPWIAWLVYRGEMVSAQASNARALSAWHAFYLIDAARVGQREPLGASRDHRILLDTIWSSAEAS